MSISSIYGEKLKKEKQVTISVELKQYQKTSNVSTNISTLDSLIYTFYLVGNIIVHTLIQGTNRGKYLNHILYTGKMPTLA